MSNIMNYRLPAQCQLRRRGEIYGRVSSFHLNLSHFDLSVPHRFHKILTTRNTPSFILLCCILWTLMVWNQKGVTFSWTLPCAWCRLITQCVEFVCIWLELDKAWSAEMMRIFAFKNVRLSLIFNAKCSMQCWNRQRVN